MFALNIRSNTRRLALAGSAVALVLGGSLSTASSAWAGTSGRQVLTPDPAAWCSMNPPTNVDSAVFVQVVGDQYTNDWKCRDLVSAGIPFAMEPETDDLGAPVGTGEAESFGPWVFYENYGIQWQAMCSEQFPGSSAEWIPGPVTGVDGAPWECQAPAGVTYDSAENSQGIHAVISGG